MVDQPAPDFEEARRDAEAWLVNDDPPQARHQLASNLSRAYLALLNERETREERETALRTALEEALEYMQRVRGGDPSLSSEEYYIVRDFARKALPATESAQAEGERS